MKFTYVNNVPVANGQVTVVLSDNAEKVMSHSCRIAKTAHDAGMGVLVINCGMSSRSFSEYTNEIGISHLHTATRTPEGTPPQLVLHSSVRGDLINEGDTIRSALWHLKIGMVIIAGWEWASSSWRRKESLLFYLRELIEDYDVSIVVYSQARTKPEKGAFDRGGIGKLAMIAGAIIRDDAAVMIGKFAPSPMPLVASENEIAAAERSALLLAKEINGLQGEKSSEMKEVESKNGEGRTDFSQGKEEGENAVIQPVLSSGEIRHAFRGFY